MIPAAPGLGEALGPAAVAGVDPRPALRLNDAVPRPAVRGRRHPDSAGDEPSRPRGHGLLRQPVPTALFALCGADPVDGSDDRAGGRRPRHVLRAYRQTGAGCQCCRGAFSAVA